MQLAFDVAEGDKLTTIHVQLTTINVENATLIAMNDAVNGSLMDVYADASLRCASFSMTRPVPANFERR